MQFTMTTFLAFAATTAFAAPLEQRQVGLCNSGTPVCCATNVLDLADLNCASPPSTPADANAFISTCAAAGQQAKCCLLPILGQALICPDVNPAAST